MRASLRYGLTVFILLLIAGGIATYLYIRTLGPQLRDRAIQALGERYDADIDLKSWSFSLLPHPTLTGNGLSIWHKDWNDPTPLIYVRKFTAISDFPTLLNRRNTVDKLRLEGLRIHIPPRGRSIRPETTTEHPEIASAEPGHDTTRFRFLVQTIVADGTVLELEPKVKGKLPLQFDVQKLTLHSVGVGQPMAFKTTLTNAKPPGLIDSTGEFGPWQREDPRSTPVSGNYTFQNADLGVFKGISGTLSSDGNYHGVLQHIEVDGTTDTPKFALQRGGEPVHLVTSFHSIVNGSDGDTILDPVDAHFLRSEFICKGGVIHEAGPNGKTVSLDAVTKRGRIEDILRLVLGSSKRILTGEVNFKSKIVIPPGHEDVLDKLKLDGQFGISSVEFTNSTLQQKLDVLSERAQGISKKAEGESPETVASNFHGYFQLNDGVASFSQLSFSVPGAMVNLDGDYALRPERINMHGTFRMQATISQTQSGIKHWLLKPFDRYFEKGGAGFLVPITITGTKDHPEFGVTIFGKMRIIH
ncbi:MAG: hypothetical protein JOY62_02565 [Acidobacteriaceae bacterium]|nr:hypothetical protein [Acidobacteriaceae bacterium]MBV9778833.1 hypothetical protein [Acidobacteriaceae bacterium]